MYALKSPLTELYSPSTETAEIDGAFVSLLLAPYKRSCVYVRREWIEREGAPTSAAGGAIRARAELAIPESCYIDDTGHFNAVEFNICFNQVAYVFTAHCAHRGLLPGMEVIDLAQ